VITIAFVHGDTQYGYERPLALLKQESFIIDAYQTFCRYRVETKLIHIGDNGDYYWGTELRDQKTWELLSKFYDEILMGNHEAAYLLGMELGGYYDPTDVTKKLMREAYESGRMKFATSHDGFLITHAGVHPTLAEELHLSRDPVKAAEEINSAAVNSPLISNIGRVRGGGDPFGGILWRDIEEPISDRWPQIHGHSRMKDVTEYGEEGSDVNHYAIDVGYPNNGRLAGIYTDTLKIAEVEI
jgi:hypothetical protein